MGVLSLFTHSSPHDTFHYVRLRVVPCRIRQRPLLPTWHSPLFRDGHKGHPGNFRKLEPDHVWYSFPLDSRTRSTVLLTERKILRTRKTTRHEGVNTYPQLLHASRVCSPNQPTKPLYNQLHGYHSEIYGQHEKNTATKCSPVS